MYILCMYIIHRSMYVTINTSPIEEQEEGWNCLYQPLRLMNSKSSMMTL